MQAEALAECGDFVRFAQAGHVQPGGAGWILEVLAILRVIGAQGAEVIRAVGEDGDFGGDFRVGADVGGGPWFLGGWFQFMTPSLVMFVMAAGSGGFFGWDMISHLGWG